jgi:hypothetical protein
VALCSQDANAWPLAQALTVALLLFRYPVPKQIADRRIRNRLHANWREISHFVTPTGYLTLDRLAVHA